MEYSNNCNIVLLHSKKFKNQNTC